MQRNAQQKSGEPVSQLRLLRLLEVLATDVLRGFKLTELTTQTGFKRSNLQRDLALLEKTGYARQDEYHYWKLSATWHAIALRFSEQIGQAQSRLHEVTASVEARAKQL